MKKIKLSRCIKYSAIPLSLPLFFTASTDSFAAKELEEIIVTAQKRAQDLQDVPIAITAYSADQLNIAGVSTIVDIEKSTPNTQLRASRGTNSTLTAFIRGVGQQDPLWGFEPGVGVYLDDVYIARPQGAALDIMDIERLEILRGPQGTLYGKNTIGGAIKYVTKNMSGDYEGKLKVSAGSYNQFDAKASGQLPLIADTLYLGAAIASLNRDGFGTQFKDYNTTTQSFDREEENYNKELIAFRANLEYTPIEPLFFKFAYDNTDDDSNNRCGSRFADNTIAGPNGEFFGPTGSVYDSECGMTEVQNVETSGYSLTAKYDVNDALSAKYIFSEREGDTQTFIDFDGTPLDSFEVPAIYNDEQTTHELQFNYATERLALVGGLYHYDGNAAGGFDALFGQFGNGILSGVEFTNGVFGDVDTESQAIYLNANINLSSDVTLTLGGRYTKDEKAANVNRQFISTANSFPGTTNQGSAITFGDPADDTLIAVRTEFDKSDANKDWSEFSPTVKLDWNISSDIMIYTSFSEGFKSGGFDMRADAVVEPNAIEGYDPETNSTYEIGVKSQVFNDRFRFNLTAFQTDYTDMQVTVQAPAPAPAFFSSTVVNAGESEIDGIEFEGTLQVTDDFLLNAAVGILDAEFVQVTELVPTGELDSNGNPVLISINRAEENVISNPSTGESITYEAWGMQNAPDLNYQIAANYEINLATLGTIRLNLAYSYRDDIRIFESNTSVLDQESYAIVDASIMWESENAHWSAILNGKNIGDKEYRTGGYNFPATAGEDAIIGFYGDPQTWTLTLAYDY